MPKLAWFWIALGAVGPVACAQVAGLDQPYVAEDGGADDDGGSPSDASVPPADARSDAPDPVDTCGELTDKSDRCARCVVFQEACRAVCSEIISDSARESYFNCLRSNDDPTVCARSERFPAEELLGTQRACIRNCQDTNACVKP